MIFPMILFILVCAGLVVVGLRNGKQEAIKQAQRAFVAALDAGVEEDALIEAVFDASNEWFAASLRRELPTYRPLYWYELSPGPEQDALRSEQEKSGYKYFGR